MSTHKFPISSFIDMLRWNTLSLGTGYRFAPDGPAFWCPELKRLPKGTRLMYSGVLWICIVFTGGRGTGGILTRLFFFMFILCVQYYLF